MGKIEWSPPDISEDDMEAMKRVIDSGWMSEGKVTEEFEERLAKYIGCKHVIVTNNATSALLTALWSSGIGHGDEVIVPTYTFIATINTPNAVGAKAVLSDCNPNTLNSEPGYMEPKITDKTRAIIPVDIAGMPIDVGAFEDFAEDRGLIMIEDGAEALGAKYRERRIGNSDHATVFSFHMAKLITTIEGGCIATNNEEIASKARMIKNHGTMKKVEKTHFFHFGMNFRTTDLQSSLGISQLGRIGGFLERRNRVAEIYNQELQDVVGLQEVPDFVSTHARMFFPIFVDEKSRDRINANLNGKGVSTRICWPPAHTQPYHGKLYPGVRLENSERIGNTIITIPLGNKTTDQEAAEVSQAVIGAVKDAKK